MSETDPEYAALLGRAAAADAEGKPTDELIEQLHARYLDLARGGVTPAGLPYPSPTDPFAEGADAIRALAEAIETKLSPPLQPITALLSDFTAAPGYEPAFFVIGSMVYLTGQLFRATAPTAFTNAFTVPYTYRPRSNTQISTVPDWAGAVQITSTGTVQIKANTARTATPGYMLDGVGYRRA